MLQYCFPISEEERMNRRILYEHIPILKNEWQLHSQYNKICDLTNPCSLNIIVHVLLHGSQLDYPRREIEKRDNA